MGSRIPSREYSVHETTGTTMAAPMEATET